MKVRKYNTLPQYSIGCMLWYLFNTAFQLQGHGARTGPVSPMQRADDAPRGVLCRQRLRASDEGVNARDHQSSAAHQDGSIHQSTLRFAIPGDVFASYRTSQVLELAQVKDFKWEFAGCGHAT